MDLLCVHIPVAVYYLQSARLAPGTACLTQLPEAAVDPGCLGRCIACPFWMLILEPSCGQTDLRILELYMVTYCFFCPTFAVLIIELYIDIKWSSNNETLVSCSADGRIRVRKRSVCIRHILTYFLS